MNKCTQDTQHCLLTIFQPPLLNSSDLNESKTTLWKTLGGGLPPSPPPWRRHCLARELGVDSHLKLTSHVNNKCKSAWLAIRNIFRFRKNLSQKDCETLVHAFITSRLDCCNSIWYGLPDIEIDKYCNAYKIQLQVVQDLFLEPKSGNILHQYSII